MIARLAGVIMAVVGGWYGHNLAVQYLGDAEGGTDAYWSEQGAIFVQILLTLFGAAVSGVATYYVLNFFRRFD